MDRIDTITVPKTLPRPADPENVKKVFGQICSRRPRKAVSIGRLRDRVLFETAYVCGTRAAEACRIEIEDMDLRLDDEHIRLHGKGGTVRTVLLDDRGYVGLLKLYLARTGYTFGPLFRVSINGSASTATGFACTNSGSAQPPTSGDANTFRECDHGQDRAQVPAQRPALRQTRPRHRAPSHRDAVQPSPTRLAPQTSASPGSQLADQRLGSFIAPSARIPV